MLLVRKESQSSQVAKILEKEIITGQIPPETKLRSTREMIDLFSVSQQVIKSAINVLEEKGLIIRKPRKGIYVSPKVFSPEQKEIICIKVGSSNLFTDYSEKFFALNGNPSYNSLNFVTKSIATENFAKESFVYELSKLIEANPDCVLISIPQISKAQVKQCLALPFPVVFIGDFSDGGFPELKYNQIAEDTAERAEASVMKAIELGKKNIVCLAGPLKYYYNKVYYQQVKTLAKKNGLQIEYIEHTDGTPVLEQVIEKRKITVRNNSEILKKADAIVIDGFQKLELFPTIFQENGLEFPGKRIVIADGGMYPGCVYVHSDYSELAKAATNRIEDIIKNPNEPKKMILSGFIKRNFFSIS